MDWQGGAMYQILCHVARKHDKLVEGIAKCETLAMNAPFGKRSNFGFSGTS